MLIACGCDNNSSTSGEDSANSGFRITPSAVNFASGDRSATYRAEGGTEPFTWSVSDSSLGTIANTRARSAAYTRTPGREGVNTILVTEASGNRATAVAIQDGLVITPPSATLSAGANSLTLTVSGGNEPLTWRVSNTALGRISDTAGRTAQYLRASETAGSNTVRVRDANGTVVEAVVLQE